MIIVEARSHVVSISKAATIIKCSKAAVKVRETGPERASCGRQTLVKVRDEKRVGALAQDNRSATVHQSITDLNQVHCIV